MLAAAVLIAAVSLAETYLSTAIFSRMGRDIRNALFEKSQALTIDQFNQFGPASMITRSTNDIMQIQMAYMAGTEMIPPAHQDVYKRQVLHLFYADRSSVKANDSAWR